jgi:predicted site-specific integrase-resolvase
MIKAMADLVPIRGAAAEIGVSVMTLYRYIKKGRVTLYRRELDGKAFVDRDELRELLEPRPIHPETP